LTEKRIIEGLIQKDEDSYRQLYTDYYRVVERYILQNKGTTDDAKDIFQETLIILHRKAGSSEISLTSSLKTYIYAIGRNLWLKKLRENRGIKNYVSEETEDSAEQKIITDELKTGLLKKLGNAFLTMTGHCKMLIYSMFFKQKSLADIAKENGYKNIHTVQNQKYKCLEQARQEFRK
jgi:RNA polymerase sigma factor (sigma-70 family)